jgi:hypothetical protein
MSEPEFTQKELRALKELIEKAGRPRALPIFEDWEWVVRGVLQADLSRRQGAKGRRSGGKRNETVALRRVLVAHVFRHLSPTLRQEPQATGTAAAIKRRLERVQLDPKPPMSIRTIKADIKFLIDNGNWNI